MRALGPHNPNAATIRPKVGLVDPLRHDSIWPTFALLTSARLPNSTWLNSRDIRRACSHLPNTGALDAICQELGQFSEVSIEDGQAIVCLVGDNIRYTPGVAMRVFGALDAINIRMISQGASLLNLSFVVAEKDLHRAVEALHTEFFAELDAEVFDAA